MAISSRTATPSAATWPLHQAPAHYAGALVTGYDFTTDEAQAIGGLYQQYGFKLNGSPSPPNYALNGTLVNDTWDVNDAEQPVVQRPAAAANQPYSGIHTNYELSSINGHFTHYEAIPANAANGSLSAARLLTPTAAADRDLVLPRQQPGLWRFAHADLLDRLPFRPERDRQRHCAWRGGQQIQRRFPERVRQAERQLDRQHRLRLWR